MIDQTVLSLSRAVRIIRTDLNHELPIQQLAMLLEVSLKEGITMTDLGQALNMGQGSVSKNVKLMSRYLKNEELKGFDLLSTEQDLRERRRFVVHTTPRGKELIEKLSNACNFKGHHATEGNIEVVQS